VRRNIQGLVKGVQKNCTLSSSCSMDMYKAPSGHCSGYYCSFCNSTSLECVSPVSGKSVDDLQFLLCFYYGLLSVSYAGRPLRFAMVHLFFIFFHISFKYLRDRRTQLHQTFRDVVWWAKLEVSVFRFSKFCREGARVKK